MSEQTHAGTGASAGPDATTGDGWLERYRGSVMNTFGDPQRVLVRGEGAWVWDADGNRYLDLLGGIAVNALGHAHPALVDAVTAQLGTLGHVSNFFTTPAQVALAERLLEIVTPGGAPAGSRVFLANSGAEANEAALKLARRHGGTARPRVLALEGAFHGRTMGALSLTHKAAYRQPFEPLAAGVEFLPFGDLAALEGAVADDVAALFLEPVQGEAGVRPLPGGYLTAARRLTRDAGALLVLDEVQSGMGRTGTWFPGRGPQPPRRHGPTTRSTSAPRSCRCCSSATRVRSPSGPPGSWPASSSAARGAADRSGGKPLSGRSGQRLHTGGACRTGQLRPTAAPTCRRAQSVTRATTRPSTGRRTSFLYALSDAGPSWRRRMCVTSATACVSTAPGTVAAMVSRSSTGVCRSLVPVTASTGTWTRARSVRGS
ncbi:aminotransferase class III-fold pyridoxal phosphate-dependent enzyme [Georgenia sp. SUBG003]|uniref:aminotransferase class III-fold pyridoxal phosphate-dependent enzyme n=1 Tax=Georgenia sp. SUBG003 TaxID=1497974 RepID=UPI003AB1626A